MLKSYQFDAFGVHYRTTQFAAMQALAIMNDPDNMPPEIVMAKTEVSHDKGTSWESLKSAATINRLVIDMAGIVPPTMVLQGIMKIVGDRSFGFMASWRGAKVPKRFLSGAKAVESTNIDPIIGSIVNEKLASLKELEEYYSLEDAFKMFDSMIVKSINAALNTEAAMAK